MFPPRLAVRPMEIGDFVSREIFGKKITVKRHSTIPRWLVSPAPFVVHRAGPVYFPAPIGLSSRHLSASAVCPCPCPRMQRKRVVKGNGYDPPGGFIKVTKEPLERRFASFRVVSRRFATIRHVALYLAGPSLPSTISFLGYKSYQRGNRISPRKHPRVFTRTKQATRFRRSNRADGMPKGQLMLRGSAARLFDHDYAPNTDVSKE